MLITSSRTDTLLYLSLNKAGDINQPVTDEWFLSESSHCSGFQGTDLKFQKAASALSAHMSITIRQWKDPKNPFFLGTLFLEKWAGILLPGLTIDSIRLIQFAASPAGTQCPEVRRGFFEESIADAENVPVFGPRAKHINLKWQSPLESSLEHLGTLSGIYQAFQSWSKSCFNKNCLPIHNLCQGFFFFLFFLLLLLLFLLLSLLLWLLSLQNVNSEIVNKPQIFPGLLHTLLSNICARLATLCQNKISAVDIHHHSLNRGINWGWITLYFCNWVLGQDNITFQSQFV